MEILFKTGVNLYFNRSRKASLSTVPKHRMPSLPYDLNRKSYLHRGRRSYTHPRQEKKRKTPIGRRFGYVPSCQNEAMCEHAIHPALCVTFLFRLVGGPLREYMHLIRFNQDKRYRSRLFDQPMLSAAHVLQHGSELRLVDWIVLLAGKQGGCRVRSFCRRKPL